MQAQRIDVASAFPGNAEIKSVSYRFEKASISVGPVSGEAHSLIRFENVLGLRILNEGDLMEFWPACSSSSGVALFKVVEGGWLAQETLRPGFVSAGRKGISEYLVVGVDECVNLLAFDEPAVTRFERGNGQDE